MRTHLLAALALALPLLSTACTGSRTSDVVLKTAITHEQLPPADPTQYLTLSADTSNRFVASGAPGEVTLRLRLDAKALRNAARPPINLALAVDTSGSMEGKSIDDARAACLALVDALSEGDRIAVVAFHSSTEVIVPSTRISKANIDGLRARIRAMQARGTTDMNGGLSAAVSEVSRHLDPKGINRIVLLGDGVPNDESQIVNIARSAGPHGISITALGLGLDYNETLMNQVAQVSGGKYHFISDSSRVASVFQEEVLRLRRVAAKNMQLRLSAGPGVVIEEIVGTGEIHAQKTAVGLGDISENESRDIIVRLKTPARSAGAVIELVDAALDFSAPAEAEQRLSQGTFVSLHATADEQEHAAGRNVEVEIATARVTLASRIVAAIAMARGGNIVGARALLDRAEKDASAEALRLGDQELTEKAAEIDELRASLPAHVAQQIAGPAAAQPVPAPLAMPMEAPQSRPNRSNRPSRPPAAVVLRSQAAAVEMIQGR